MPIPTNEGDEIYPNGIFNFNITKLLEHITAGMLDAEKELINVSEWFKTHLRGSVNEEHVLKVDIWATSHAGFPLQLWAFRPTSSLLPPA